ncbi:DUF2235 domain-containing protein [Grimontia sp. SpTr1]|uniref:DUF2235 domain-containing protein n=1 Tax=Grimontia sp. SpTr1 TaxID=2995319 RepID=UPI00248B0B2E|nr:DUF2235 domain-containing protein [Grimontia sp. SpTr1]
MTELASYEFGKVEGGFSTLGERALEAVLPQGVTIQKFQSQLASGEYVLLSDAPVTPALKSTTNSMGDKVWQVNPDAESSFSPEAKSALASRTKAKGFTSRSGSESQAPAEAPYTPEPKVEEKQEKPAQDYEYLFEVACSEEVLASEVGCQFALGKTPKEASIVSWETKLSDTGTVFSAKATDDTPRKLIAKVASAEKGVSNQPPVKLKPKGTDAVREAFIPVIPALQLGDRLGFPTEGYFYHFHKKKLVQEYKILGEGRWAFQATRSTPFSLNNEQGLNKYQGAILLYWKIDSKVVTDQHLVYLDAPITQEQLGNVSDEWLNKNGVEIDIPTLLDAKIATTAAKKPYKPKTYNAPADVVYDHKERLLNGSTLKAINNERLVESGLPVVNIRKLPEKTFRFGIFFDGTGNNLENDKYKENRGNASRTNVARLFEAYQEKEGEIAKIYVSGIGTVDYDNVPRAEMERAIDEGDDLTTWAMATGAQDFLSFSETAAYFKWQRLLNQLHFICTKLKNDGLYSDITHIEFDVFGFSRGAALARHFVNAANEGMPNYELPRSGSDGLSITPNLLGGINRNSYDSKEGYKIDLSKRVSVRFVGLFDTVGSFYLAGNNDEGEFKLSLAPDSAETVYHIAAFHEYRNNFPLTSLKINQTLPDNFFEDIFPGAHADVGGGYPSIGIYDKQGLPARYGMPISESYNRELVKTEPVDEGQYFENEILLQKGLSNAGGDAWALGVAKQKEKQWNVECQKTFRFEVNKGQHGHVRYYNKRYYFYRLQPLPNALQGLALLRMFKQSQEFGVLWEAGNLVIPEDFMNNDKLVSLERSVSRIASGSVSPSDWLSVVDPKVTEWIHRPYDISISKGYEGITAKLANSPRRNANGELEREIFSNE